MKCTVSVKTATDQGLNVLCNVSTHQCSWSPKSESMKQLIQEKAIDILILTKSKVYTKSAIQSDGFQMFPVVRGKSGDGGLLIAVKHGTCSSIMVDEGENAEFVTVKMEFGNICSDSLWFMHRRRVII